MRFAQRRMESASAQPWFAEHGFTTSYVGRDGVGAHFEAGDAFPWGGELLVGYGPRTEELALKHLATDLGVAVRGFRLVHPAMYHFDLAFCPLDERRAIVAPSALDDASASALLDLVPEPLVLTEEETLASFAANSVVVGSTVVMPACPDRVREQLEDWGFTVELVDVTEFHKGGGSIRCLTNPMDITLGRDLTPVLGGGSRCRRSEPPFGRQRGSGGRAVPRSAASGRVPGRRHRRHAARRPRQRAGLPGADAGGTPAGRLALGGGPGPVRLVAGGARPDHPAAGERGAGDRLGREPPRPLLVGHRRAGAGRVLGLRGRSAAAQHAGVRPERGAAGPGGRALAAGRLAARAGRVRAARGVLRPDRADPARAGPPGPRLRRHRHDRQHDRRRDRRPHRRRAGAGGPAVDGTREVRPPSGG